jgi:hypothetical protein
MTTLRDWDFERGLGSGLGVLKPPKQALLEALLGRCSLQQTQLLLAILPRAQQLKGNEGVRGGTYMYLHELGLNLRLQHNLFPKS